MTKRERIFLDRAIEREHHAAFRARRSGHAVLFRARRDALRDLLFLFDTLKADNRQSFEWPN